MKKWFIMMLLVSVTSVFGMSVNALNSADKAELMQISGIGEVKAAAIIKERRKGKFKSFDDLEQRVSGIGEQTAANLKGDVKNGDAVKKVKHKTVKHRAKRKKSTAASMKSTTKYTKKTEKQTKKKAESRKSKAKKAEKELKKNKKKVKKEKSRKTKKSKKRKKAKKAA